MNNDNFNNSFSLVRFVWERKIRLLIICFVTAVLSFFFSSKIFIKPEYKSTAIIYAPRTNSTSKILLNEENYNEKLDIKAYATEVETEQMMQLLDAREIKDSLIQKYRLADYYEINLQKKGGYTKLYKILTSNIAIKRTDFGAISISVKDWNPQQACDMANDIVRLLDTIKNRTERTRATIAYQILQNQLDSINLEVAKIDDSLQVCMRHGVFDVESQSERIMQQYAIAVAQGNTAAITRLNDEQRKLATWGAKWLAFRDLQSSFIKYQSLCKEKMMSARLDMAGNIPVKFIVDTPIPADKKCYPKKSIIVLVSTLSVFILSIIVLLIIEKIEERPADKPEKTV